MNLKKDLPKLGKDADWKRIGLPGVELGLEEILITTVRPDYAMFSKKEYVSECDCVAVLVGLKAPNRVVEESHRIQRSSHKNGISENDFNFILRVRWLFEEIRKDINFGIAAKEIREINIDPSSEEKALFSSSRGLHTFDFLQWMQRNGYPIPDELNIWRKRKYKQITIPVQPETKWFQIRFRIVNRNRIEITTPDGMEPFHPDDLGFTQKIWDQFEQFAITVEHTPGTLDGRAGKIHRSVAPEHINADKTDVSRLRRLLRAVFPGVDGDPIPHEKFKGYKAEFHITEA